MKVEDEYQDVLENLEFAIIQVYKEHHDLIDAEVLMAIEALIRLYNAEAQGKNPAGRPVRGITKKVMEAVQPMCEWQLGRASLQETLKNSPNSLNLISVNVLVDCLKRIQSSINFWTKERGRQGYLNFIGQFVG